MKPMLCFTLAAALAGGAHADDKPEVVVEKLLDSYTKIVVVLEGIKDAEGATKAKPELDKTYEAMKKIEEAFKQLSNDDKERLRGIFEGKFEAVRKRFQKESERLRNDEKVAKVLADFGPFKALRQQQEAVARIKALTIATALQAYKVQHNKYPDDLETLVKGEKPFLEASAIKDPWGKAFKYDPAGPEHKGAKPDVWTVTPEGKTIGNWEETPKEKE
jgi:hypothetical protein